MNLIIGWDKNSKAHTIRNKRMKAFLSAIPCIFSFIRHPILPPFSASHSAQREIHHEKSIAVLIPQRTSQMRGFLDVMRCSLNRPVRRGRGGGEYLDMKYHFMEGRFYLVSLYGIIYLKSVYTYS
jgi:hypothetical protein